MNKLTEKSSAKIQVLRGLAIIAVGLIHNTPQGLAQVWGRPLLNFSVGLFLFISGMLSSSDRWNPKKRIIKIIIPYCIWTLIYVVISHYDNITSIPLEFLKGLIFANSAAVMYYVFVYCELTMLIPLIDRLSRSQYKWLGLVISPLEMVIMRLIPTILGIGVNKHIALIMHISCVGWFTYFYLGYLLGNNLLRLEISSGKLAILWIGSLVLQVFEGYFFWKMGDGNCGTQLKVSALITGVLFAMMAYRYIFSDKLPTVKFLLLLGDKSFGIFFSHLAVMSVLRKIPYYDKLIYPINACFTIVLSFLCVVIGGKILGKKAKYLAL